jgi:DNA-binding transcriptional regulator YhcF (GntR family)
MIDFFKLELNDTNNKPKYKQIVDSISDLIQSGNIKYGQKLPSINQVSFDYYISRDTVEKAYAILKENGVIESVKGRGHFVVNSKPNTQNRILVVFNKLSSYKKEIFNSFCNQLGEFASIYFHVHHCEFNNFKTIIEENLNGYNYYVIMPHFNDFNFKKFDSLMHKIKKEKIILLDDFIPNFTHYSSCIYQDFKDDLFSSLTEAKKSLKKYQMLCLVFPKGFNYPYPKSIVQGFMFFCNVNNFKSELINEISDDHKVNVNTAYIVIKESDLVNLIRKIRQSKLKLAQDVGVLSYNDTPLKEILSDGISVISTDFNGMGKLAAKSIIENENVLQKNKFRFIERKSL